ncbi:hypothetical protein U0070_020277 [Myodes glareolus]|uniref:UBZ4-type domain-containing protein n=1 Tax=Myodes glareolus TaxID=447135 RepID=A0AAW0JDN4_MYOGA
MLNESSAMYLTKMRTALSRAQCIPTYFQKFPKDSTVHSCPSVRPLLKTLLVALPRMPTYKGRKMAVSGIERACARAPRLPKQHLRNASVPRDGTRIETRLETANYVSQSAMREIAGGDWDKRFGLVGPLWTTLPDTTCEALPAAGRGRVDAGAGDVRHERRPPSACARPATSPEREGRAARGLAAGIGVSGPEDDPFLSQLHQVQCPVCQQMMPAAHINSHLDRCLLLHPAGHAEPAAGSHRAGERAKGPSPPSAKRRRLSESSALKQPATPTAAESSEGEGEEGDDGGETESRESYDAPPTPSGARLIPDFPVARSSSPARKGLGKRPAAAAAAGSASPRSWDEAEAQEEEEAGVDGDGDADVDGEEDPGHWDADAADASFGVSAGRSHPRALAAEEIRQMLEGKPLADKMRPDTLQDYIGQSRAVGQETLLRSLLETNEIPSLILWGPPGCGKTTLAHIIANNSKKHSIRFVTLSATNAKTNDVRDVIKQAQNEKSFFKRKTILFIDEIHRFNKSQQDTFLPHVECGTITLIGATTENPSFQVNAALLSRCRVIVLEKLPVEAMVTILMRAINSLGIHVVDSSRPTDPLSHSSNCSSE